jgi:hypothetical protein
MKDGGEWLSKQMVGGLIHETAKGGIHCTPRISGKPPRDISNPGQGISDSTNSVILLPLRQVGSLPARVRASILLNVGHAFRVADKNSQSLPGHVATDHFLSHLSDALG